jgi:hypothetical protein
MPDRGVAGSRSDNGELAKLLALAAGCSRVVVFSGSGLSAPSGAAACTHLYGTTRPELSWPALAPEHSLLH